MNQFDFAPLYRSAIGFDRLARILNNASRNDAQPSYPPYNIEIAGENAYRITMAVAGFDRSEIEIEVEQDGLKVTGRKTPPESQPTYLHRGIAARDFSHRFQLAEHVRVVGASLQNGLLDSLATTKVDWLDQLLLKEAFKYVQVENETVPTELTQEIIKERLDPR